MDIFLESYKMPRLVYERQAPTNKESEMLKVSSPHSASGPAAEQGKPCHADATETILILLETTPRQV